MAFPKWAGGIGIRTMSRRPGPGIHGISRRGLLRAGAAAGASAFATHAAAQDSLLQSLIENQQSDFGQTFDPGSRAIQMPKATLPTLSRDTVRHTEQAIQKY